MADTKLKYWYDWEIYGPDGEMLVNLRTSPPPIDKNKVSDTDYLCQRIIDFPDSTLMNSDVWYRLTILRQQSFKDKEGASEWKRVCKALRGGSRKRKTEETIDDLQAMILNDIIFFKEVLERVRNEGITVKHAIEDFLRRGDKDGKDWDNRFRQESNWENTYYAYKQVYDHLLKFELSEAEIFSFFNGAALNLHSTNAHIDAEPDGRLLTFVKVKTWYVRGPDMHVQSTQS